MSLQGLVLFSGKYAAVNTGRFYVCRLHKRLLDPQIDRKVTSLALQHAMEIGSIYIYKYISNVTKSRCYKSCTDHTKDREGRFRPKRTSAAGGSKSDIGRHFECSFFVHSEDRQVFVHRHL